jgi:hypothetical protein
MGGWKKNEYPPPEFLRQAINTARRTVAHETRCLQCWNTTTGDKDYGDYTLPNDCIMVLDVMYDNIPLRKKTNWTMNYLRRYILVKVWWRESINEFYLFTSATK